jgi:hypothetical protein
VFACDAHGWVLAEFNPPKGCIDEFLLQLGDKAAGIEIGYFQSGHDNMWLYQHDYMRDEDGWGVAKWQPAPVAVAS